MKHGWLPLVVALPPAPLGAQTVAQGERGPYARIALLRPRPSLSAVLEGKGEQALPEAVQPLVVKATVEILGFRPTLSYGISPPGD